MTTMNRHPETGSEPRVRGVASAVFFLALFSTLWAFVGIGGLHGLYETRLTVVTILIGLALIVGGISLNRSARRLPQRADRLVPQGRQRMNKWFFVIFAIELLSIVIAHVLLSLVNRLDLFLPVTMFIVGVHFFPMAALFRIKIYNIAGALLCAVVIITFFVVPQSLRLDGFQIAAWQVVLGFCAAIILWACGFFQWLNGKRLLVRKTHKD